MSGTEFIAPPDTPELHISHRFDAPLDLVFKTWTDPQLIPQWWGPAYLKTTVEKMEPRNGGSYRIFQRAPDSKLHGFRGVYHTVEAPHLIIATFEYDGAPNHVALDTHHFAAEDGKTLYTGSTIFQSLVDRNAMLQGNCEPGVRETMARMAQLLRQRMP